MAQIDDQDSTVISASGAQTLGGTALRICPKCGLSVADSTNICPQDGTQIFEPSAQLLSSKYEFMTVAGSGGMSVVYKARKTDTGEIVAIKMLHSLLMNDQSLKRFEQEAKAIKSLKHPNIINVHDYGVSEHGQPYMVMDYIDGSTLADVIKEKGGLSLEESLHRFIQLCDALEHAHESGVLHRDLKPSNIMISNRDGNFEDARIVDFGIAKLMDKEDRSDGHLTQTGELFGSPLYMSPEQCRGSVVDARTDIYSMGCVMYETMTGRPPLKGASMIETIVLQMTTVPSSLSEMSSDKQFPDQLEQLIANALAKDPDDRYQTMTELEYALMQIRPSDQNKKTIRSGKNKSFSIKTKTPLIVAASFLFGALLVALPTFVWLNHKVKSADVPVVVASEKQLMSSQKSLIDRATHIRAIRRKMGEQELIECLDPGDLGVTKMDISESNIHDIAATHLQNQHSLVTIDLDEDPISDTTFGALKGLPNLEEVSARRTRITDEGLRNLIPLGRHLKRLYLTNTRIDNYGLITIAREFPVLSDLSICELKFDNQHFAKLNSLSLKTLYADQTLVDDTGASALCNMSSLEDLQLSYTNIGDKGVSSLHNLKNLSKLGLANTRITNTSMQTISNFRNLNELDIGGTNITKDGGKALFRLTKLEDLGLYNTKITNNVIANLVSLHLKSLNLANDDITDGAIENIVKIHSLEKLDLGGTKVTDNGVLRLQKLQNLDQLILIDCPNITLPGIRTFHNRCPGVRITLLQGKDEEDLDWEDPRNWKTFPPR